MLVVDVVEPLVPRLDAPFLQADDRLAETAPETALAVATHAALLTLFFHVLLVFGIGEIVIFVQMDHEQFAAVEEAAALSGSLVGPGLLASGRHGAGAGWNRGFGALPDFDLVVHGILVAFPVVFTAEAAWAVGVGAAVGAGMAFDVFTVHVSSVIFLLTSPTPKVPKKRSRKHT